jgi:hypothetical protein
VQQDAHNPVDIHWRSESFKSIFLINGLSFFTLFWLRWLNRWCQISTDEYLLVEIAEIDEGTISDDTQIIDITNNKYLIFQKPSWYWISQNLNLSRVDRVTVSLYIPIIFDWRNNLIDDNRFIRIFGE